MKTYSNSRDININGYDFDTLKTLAQDDPAKLEALRQQWTQAIIAQASSEQTKRRLQGIEFKVNLERERKGSDIGRCVRISKMMHESCAELWTQVKVLLGNAEKLNALTQQHLAAQNKQVTDSNKVVTLADKR